MGAGDQGGSRIPQIWVRVAKAAQVSSPSEGRPFFEAPPDSGGPNPALLNKVLLERRTDTTPRAPGFAKGNDDNNPAINGTKRSSCFPDSKTENLF